MKTQKRIFNLKQSFYFPLQDIVLQQGFIETSDKQVIDFIEGLSKTKEVKEVKEVKPKKQKKQKEPKKLKELDIEGLSILKGVR